MRLRWAAALASAAVVVVTAISGGAALATPPVTLGSSAEYVLDESGVLSSAQRSEAQSRLEQLKSDTGLDLWVVYVDEFTDPASAADWANQTADDNNLGVSQYLLAVATQGRAYYLSGDPGGPVSDEQLATIEQQQIQPALAQDDWLGAVDAAADGLTDAVGGSGAAATGSGGAGWLTWLLVIVVVGIGIVLLVMFLRRRKKGAVTAGPAGPPQPSVEELERRASSLLVATDDAIKTSTQELGFAKAQFGDAATTEFEAALATAQQSLDEAFGLKQKLDDHIPDSEQDTRAWNERIIALCEASNALLDEKAAAFDELRKLEQNAPEALARVHDAKAKAEASLDQATSRLQSLQTAYAPEALATVVDNPEQARQRLAFADEQLTAAEAAIGAGDGGEAAVGIRAAEEAVGQAMLLENAIDKLQSDLAEGERNATALVAELESDIAAASALPDTDGRIADVIASTRQQLDAARAQLSGTAKRPLAALQSLEAANTQIDTLVQGVRDAEAQAERARQMVGQVMMQAQAQVSAAEDYITARRGAVGAQARTRLAEAGASLARAQALQASDPQQAMQQAQRADQLAGQAIQLAQSDVGAFDAGSGGMFGPSQQGGQSGGGMLGAVLGGIVLNSVLSGGRSSGGMGGGLGGMLGGGPSRSSGGMRPGSFGGGGTRARRGGGRF
ncbi:putative membrane protein YgcG/predicted nucleic acid-binding Zn-ribbon protein [Microbacterium trichothecenolyticum]|uniref:TPM domain-containing protein n=1 Tax=Microbacterium trichothecenolyticum TaxID=69370 RepID=UPI00285BC088|nr:TPM domain-containing protein [Microbacterium trichothecenolyticum]MDR7112771.1 putative membrane protein YgcG/predicted nucleic acid-binding Zn-ribbon protein [Microbacterium trichothecenolyticum]